MTITVNNNADTDVPTQGFMTLREAIELSNGTLTVGQLSAAGQNQVVVNPTATPAPGAPAIPNTIEFGIETAAEVVNWGDGSNVPTSGSSLVVVGLDDNLKLHIRYFNNQGVMAADWVQGDPTPDGLGATILNLSGQVLDWVPPFSLSASQQAQIVTESEAILAMTFDTTITPTSAPLPAITAPVTIDGYSQVGASVSGPSEVNTDVNNAVIQINGNNLGAGTPGVGFDGLDIEASNCVIDGLIVTGFSGVGISISGAGSQGNWVWGDFIGAQPDPINGRYFESSEAALPGLSNAFAGIEITSSNNRIGGNTPGLFNVIANNGYNAAGNSVGGVGLLTVGQGGTGNLIQGNGIFNNAAQGVLLESSNNTLGEALGGGGNSIAGNGSDGVLITGGPDVQGNGLLGNFIGTMFGTVDNTITLGQTADPNHGNGVLIDNSLKNYIGSTLTASKNIIGANDLDGVSIIGAAAFGNSLLNDWIGFNIVNGLEAFLPNQNGVYITAPGTQIGDGVNGVGNVIDNNRLNGILLSGANTSGTVIADNIIGLNPGGGSAFPNSFDGVYLNNAPNVTIGGIVATARNTISSNNNGIYVSGPGSTGELIEGNFLGTATDGVTDLGNAVNGVVLDNAPNNAIGGSVAGAANVISGNNRGVVITGAGATRNEVQGDFIGTDLSAKVNIHNEIDGILVTAGASNNLIGGTVAGAGNTIFNNAGAGVNLDSGTGNSVLGNGIDNNSMLGISLNPLNDANQDQAAPVVVSVAPVGAANTIVQATLDAAANTTYRVEYFSSPTKDHSGFGQGQTFLDAASVTTDDLGHAAISETLPTAVASGLFVSATATDPSGNTSGFSNAVPAVPVSLQFAAPTYTISENGNALVVGITRTGGTGGAVAVSYATGGGTAVGGVDYTSVSGTLFFNPGDPATKTFVVPILDAHKIGGSVSFNITLSSPTNGAVLASPTTTAVTIQDNDIAATQFVASTTNPPYSIHGAGVLPFTIQRNSPNGVLTVHYATTDGTAKAGVNYVAASGTATFQPGQTTLTIPVTALDDFQVHTSNLTFHVTLSNPSSGTLGPNSAVTATIVPNNSPGTFSLSLYKLQTNPGAASASLTVYRTVGKTGTTTVHYATGGGTAKAGVDYKPVSGTLTFAPGQYSQTITVPLLNDSVPGANNTFNLTLSSPTNGASLGSPSSTAITVVHPTTPINPAAKLPPIVLGVTPISGPQGIYALVVTFNKALNPATAQDATNYSFYVAAPGKSTPLSVGVAAAAYSPAKNQVVLFLGAAVPKGGYGLLVIDASAPVTPGHGVTDLYGNLLDGTGTGKKPGTPYSAIVP